MRTSGDAKFMVPKPLTTLGIGLDALPEKIRFSKDLSGNDLGQLGNLEKLPSDEEISSYKNAQANLSTLLNCKNLVIERPKLK